MIISDIDHGRLSWLIPRAASSSNFSVNNSIGPQHAKKSTHQVVCLERGQCLSDDSKRECVPLILSTNVKQNLEAFFLPTSTTLHLRNSRGYLPFLMVVYLVSKCQRSFLTGQLRFLFILTLTNLIVLLVCLKSFLKYWRPDNFHSFAGDRWMFWSSWYWQMIRYQVL